MNNMFSAFRKTISSIFGLRECAQLIHIAKDTNSIIEINVGSKSGTSESISSLILLGLTPGMSIVFSIKGGNQSLAYTRINDLINEGWTRDNAEIIDQIEKDIYHEMEKVK